MVEVSAYVPCFNNEKTIVAAAESLQAQTPKPIEIFVVDDGSTDGSVKCAKEAGLRVIELGKNCGRGTARARAMEVARGELVLACDATARLAPTFLQKALPHFQAAKTVAVFGRVVDPQPQGFRRRWRARHLLKAHSRCEVIHGASLATWGAVMRRQATLDLGNFDRSLRHSEDEELGRRILAAGGDVIMEPNAELHPQTENSVPQLLERYWRWNVGYTETFGAGRYFKQMVYSARVMAANDLREGDLGAAAISLMTPHYFLWRRLTRKGAGQQ